MTSAGPSERSSRHRHEVSKQPQQPSSATSSMAPLPLTPSFASQASSIHVVSRLVSPFTAVLLLCSLLAYLAFTQARTAPTTTSLLLGRPAAGSNQSAMRALADPEAEKSTRFDKDAHVVRLDLRSGEKRLDPRQDSRGWMIDPLVAAKEAGLQAGSTSCLVVHLGEVLPGRTRGNHRHHSYNETLVLWGARIKLRNENRNIPKGYAEVILAADDVAVVAGPAMHAHAITNIDESRPAYLVACQDGVHDPANPDSDYGVWKDL